MRRALLIAALLLLAAPAARAADPTLTPIAPSFDAPTYVTSPPGDMHRVFVVEKTGAIRIVKDGQVLGTPFLSLVGQVSGDTEQGLLSMAFAPDYATSGLFYVDYTDTSGTIRVVEYHVSANPDVANAASARPILSQPHPGETNHNGGQLEFGPDGYLYVGLGDGGGSGDPNGNGQNLGTWLGKILRIDPHPSNGQPYTVPPGNPFAGAPAAKPEIWAYGLRNPWRFSFDSATGDLWTGDVGQDAYEEIDHAARGVGGQNYGWNVCEGSHTYPAGGACTTGVLPVLDYHHDNGRCAVTGGYVVRDPTLPELAGSYIYGDYCSGEIWTVRPPAAPQLLSVKLPGLSSFGEDSCLHLYAMSSESGAVARVTSTSAAACPAAGPGGDGGAGGFARKVTVVIAGRVSRSGRAPLRVGCSAGFLGRCRVTLTVRRTGHRAAGTRRFSVSAGHSRTVHTRLVRSARRSLARHRRLAVRVAAVGRDTVGSAKVSKRLTLKATRRVRARTGR
jgi:glucose/arabinose dehydrogenase